MASVFARVVPVAMLSFACVRVGASVEPEAPASQSPTVAPVEREQADETPAQPDSFNQRVCEHILRVVGNEMRAAGEVVEPSAADIAKFNEECIKDLALERANIGDQEFERQAHCVLAAETLERMAACDPDS